MSSNTSSVPSIMSAPAPAKSAKRVSKKTEDAPAAPVAAAVAAPVAAAPAAPAKATKAKKAEAAPAAVAAPAATVAATPVAATTAAPATDAAVVVEEVRLEAEVKALTSRAVSMREALSELITECKRVEKKAAKLQKVADKRRRKSKPVDGAPPRISIFQIPVAISPALCKFLGRESGSLESRSNVTSFVNKYVTEHNLKNKHEILPDAALKSLLTLKDGDKLTYFNLQHYLNQHYPKKAVPAAPAAPAVTA